MGDDGMIIEGGTGAFFPLIVNQIKSLGIAPERIKYLTLTHTHPDHIGAVPHLKKLWPHLKVMGSAGAAKALKRLTEKPEALKEFLASDRAISLIRLNKGEIPELPHGLTITFSTSTMFWRKEKISSSAKKSSGRYIILPVIRRAISL